MPRRKDSHLTSSARRSRIAAILAAVLIRTRRGIPPTDLSNDDRESPLDLSAQSRLSVSYKTRAFTMREKGDRQ